MPRKRKPGRPKGSKNKPTITKVSPETKLIAFTKAIDAFCTTLKEELAQAA